MGDLAEDLRRRAAALDLAGKRERKRARHAEWIDKAAKIAGPIARARAAKADDYFAKAMEAELLVGMLDRPLRDLMLDLTNAEMANLLDRIRQVLQDLPSGSVRADETISPRTESVLPNGGPPYRSIRLDGNDDDETAEEIRGNNPLDAAPDRPLVGLRLIPAAQWVLEDAGGVGVFLPFGEIAERAVKHGYHPPRAGGDMEKIKRSFLDEMRRLPHVFLRRNLWEFGLAPEGTTVPDEDDDLDSERNQRRKIAEEMIRERGGPVRSTEIADGIIASGLPHPEKKKHLFNSINVTLERSPKFRKVAPGVWTLAEMISDVQRQSKAQPKSREDDRATAMATDQDDEDEMGFCIRSVMAGSSRRWMTPSDIAKAIVEHGWSEEHYSIVKSEVSYYLRSSEDYEKQGMFYRIRPEQGE